MYFEKVDISEIPANHRGSKIGEEILTLIKEFEKTDFEAVEVKDWTHKNAKSFIAMGRTVLKRYKITTVKFVESGNKAFIVKDFGNNNVSVINKK